MVISIAKTIDAPVNVFLSLNPFGVCLGGIWGISPGYTQMSKLIADAALRKTKRQNEINAAASG